MNRFVKVGLLILMLVLFVGCDRLTKNIAREELASSAGFSYFHGLIQLEYTENSGSFMSLGSDLPRIVRQSVHLFSAAVVVTGLVLVGAHVQRIAPKTLAGLTLLLAGASGNLWDRFFNDGRVIDFIMIDVGRAHTGVFNLADIFITAGVLVLFLGAWGWNKPTPSPRGE